MKRTLQVLGIIFITLALIVGGFFGYVAYTGNGLDASSKKYVDSNVPIIVQNWSEAAFKVRYAQQEMKNIDPRQLDKLFQWFSNSLGPMKEYCGSKGEANIFVSPQKGRVVSARYKVCAKFEKSDATIDVTLIQNKDKSWAIYGFHVNSNALLPR